jgi:microcystin-dependent protein
MSYQIDRSDTNNGSITVEDQTIDQSTSLSFVGKNFPGYASYIAENFLQLLENFASSAEPANPIAGQLWYDTNTINNPPQPQLKVYDGVKFVAAGSVIKRTVRPTTAVIGDLWVDTSSQQLYLWSGSNWILVGPQFSEGTQSGPKIESIFDTVNVLHTIISFIVNNEIVAIVSKDAFTPKSVISGFPIINQGINMSSKDFDLDGTMSNKFWGTADRADKLIVSGYPDGLDANTFLRSDVASTTNFSLSIRNNNGLIVGSDLNTELKNTPNGETILSNKSEGSSIFVRTNTSGVLSNAITVTGNRVGINKNPTEALDVTGKIVSTGGMDSKSTTDSTSLITGSIVTAGGVGIAKTLRVGTGANITGTITSNNILPSASSVHDLGSETLRYRTVYANTMGNLDGTTIFRGEFTGAFNGSVTGTATRLTSPTNFSLIGDVSSNTISFNGAQIGGVATFTTVLSPDVITQKDQLFDSLSTDELLINRLGIGPTAGLKKITKTTFLANVATVPIGSIITYAGPTPPSGYLLCDGAEVLISAYPELFSVLGDTYKGPENYIGLATFRLPDLRGRFPLGKDSMNNGIAVPLAPTGATSGTTIGTSANRVTSVAADQIGLSSGVEEAEIQVKNLPEHTHNLTGDAGTQFYAVTDDTTGSVAITDDDAVGRTAQLIPGFSRLLTSAGTVDSTQVDVPLNVMNPYLTINYIIFTGRIN